MGPVGWRHARPPIESKIGAGSPIDDHDHGGTDMIPKGGSIMASVGGDRRSGRVSCWIRRALGGL